MEPVLVMPDILYARISHLPFRSAQGLFLCKKIEEYDTSFYLATGATVLSTASPLLALTKTRDYFTLQSEFPEYKIGTFAIDARPKETIVQKVTNSLDRQLENGAETNQENFFTAVSSRGQFTFYKRPNGVGRKPFSPVPIALLSTGSPQVKTYFNKKLHESSKEMAKHHLPI